MFYIIVRIYLGQQQNFIMGIKELGDWSIPQHLKLRFSQQFNQLDRSRIGMLTGAQARGVLGESQLPMNILAQIWTMSDVNKDGCLSIEEFCVAMYLIEMIKVTIEFNFIKHNSIKIYYLRTIN